MKYSSSIKKEGHDIEADWVITEACNFNCFYCSINKDQNKFAHNTNKHVPAERIINFVKNSGLKWSIHFTGGEPFIYPDFVKLCKELTNENIININTNLSQQNVVEFSEIIDPMRVSFINCGLHMLEREKNNLLEDFIQKYSILREKKFILFVSYVMHPQLFNRFQKDFEYLKQHEIIISPKAMRGYFEGNKYPEAYSPEERVLFIKYSKASERLLTNKFRESPIIDLSTDRKFIYGIPDFRGRLCTAGKDFIRVWPDGKITKCSKSNYLGSILDKQLTLLDKPEICMDYSCPYFCFRYCKES